MPRRPLPAPVLICLLAALLLAMASPAWPASKHAKSKSHAKAATPRSSSEETRAERERRLRRECQGRPNAGACLGYTQ